MSVSSVSPLLPDKLEVEVAGIVRSANVVGPSKNCKHLPLRHSLLDSAHGFGEKSCLDTGAAQHHEPNKKKAKSRL